MPVEAVAKRAGWLEIHPSRRAFFASCGLESANDFLKLPGVVVSGHVGRNVSRVRIGDETSYLKREHRVRHRDRFRNLLDGFGLASISHREARLLARLEERGLPGPVCLAHGEADGQAFLLVEEAENAIDLRQFLLAGELRIAAIGRTIADIHDSGIDQPDLFAKHFLIDPESGRITILDWQRATIRERVPLTCRIRSLASLRATCSNELLSDARWQDLLRAYCERSSREMATQVRRADCIDPDGFSKSIAEEASRLSKRPSIRRQFAPTSPDQELVRIHGETVCAIPEIAKELEQPEAIDSLYDPANQGRTYRFRNGRLGVLHVTRYRLPLQKWFAAVRGKNWRSAELRRARLLFHLERHGIPTPKLLAYGQAGNKAFCLDERLDVRPTLSTDRDSLMRLLQRLHDASCSLIGNPFGMLGTEAVVAYPEFVRLRRRLSRSQVLKDRARIEAMR